MANKKKKKKKLVKAKKAAPKKKAAKKVVVKSRSSTRKVAPTKKAPARRVRGRSGNESSLPFESAGLGAGSGGQSGDLQGLSSVGGADSESVDELLEEGNAFEAEAVKGVEDSPDADEGEVKTHEVPEDDVPEEYQDNEP